MKTKSLTLTLVAAATIFAFVATPAEAGGRHKRYNNNYYGGNNCGGYYQPQPVYYRPVQYYRPVYYGNSGYYQRPFFQIGFNFGGNGCR